jgi:hypothetical protein
MICKYKITINGKEQTLFEMESATPIDNYEKLVEELKRQVKKDPAKFKELSELLKNASNVQVVNLSDIDENGISKFTPGDLIKDISGKNNEHLSFWKRLNIPGTIINKGIVVAGFGTNGESTRFHNNHIYVNLNYTDDQSNKIIALVELALSNVMETYDPDLMKSAINTNPVEADALLDKVIKTTNKKIKNNADIKAIEFLKNSIKTAYYKTNIITDLGSKNLSFTRKNLSDVFDTYNPKNENRDENYLPRSYVDIQNLKQGDLVFIPNPEKATNALVLEPYEIFYDYYLDSAGDPIIRTVHQSDTGEYYLAKRVASKYQVKEGVKEIKKSTNIEARIFNNEVYDAFKYKDKTKYLEIPLKGNKKTFRFEWTLALLKNPESVVVVKNKKKTGPKSKPDDSVESQSEVLPENLDKVKSEESRKVKIKKIQGASIFLEENVSVYDYDTKTNKSTNVITIQDLEYIGVSEEMYSDVDFTLEASKDNFDFRYFSPSVGDKIIATLTTKKDGNEITRDVIGKVVGFTKNLDGSQKIIYVTKIDKTYKVHSTGIVKAVEKPLGNAFLTLAQESDIVKLVSNKLNGKKVGESVIANKGKFGLNLDNLTYSIQDVDAFSPFHAGDILYNIQTNTSYKVLDSKNTYIKTVTRGGNGLIYLNINKDQLEPYVLLSEITNIGFASANLIKNRYVIFTNEGANTHEIEVWRNGNGHIWITNPGNAKNNPNYEASGEFKSVNYTNEMKSILKDRYKLTEIPKTLYSISDASNSNKRPKDSYNTVTLQINSANFKQIIDNKLLNYIVPGSFITFAGDANSYIVERASGDKLLVAKYSATKTKSSKMEEISKDFAYIKSEKFYITKELLNKGLEIVNIHLPKWATISYENIHRFKIDDTKKFSIDYNYDKSDSREFVIQLSEFLKDKYGVNINLVHNSELGQFNDPEVYKSSAFVIDNEIYVNIDRASIAEPLHEMLHLVFATMKANNPDTYYRLINSVQYHPMFKEVSKIYNDINSEVLEETFIQLFTKTFRKNIKKEGIFTQEVFGNSIRETVANLLDLSENISWEDPFDLMRKPIKNILTEFGSSLINNSEGLIDSDKVTMMFEIVGTVRQLIDEGKLEQKCNY